MAQKIIPRGFEARVIAGKSPEHELTSLGKAEL